MEYLPDLPDAFYCVNSERTKECTSFDYEDDKAVGGSLFGFENETFVMQTKKKNRPRSPRSVDEILQSEFHRYSSFDTMCGADDDVTEASVSPSSLGTPEGTKSGYRRPAATAQGTSSSSRSGHYKSFESESPEIEISFESDECSYSANQQVDALFYDYGKCLELEPDDGPSLQESPQTPPKPLFMACAAPTPQPKPTKVSTTPVRIRNVDYGNKIGCPSRLCLRLDDYNVAIFHQLIHDLWGKEHIREMEIYRAWHGHRLRSPKDMAVVFDLIRSLPNLKVLRMINLEARDVNEDFQRALYSNYTITALSLHISSGALDPTSLLVFRTMPSLTQLAIEAAEPMDFSTLLRSTSIRNLCILGKAHRLGYEQILPLVELLQANDTLNELKLEPDMSPLAFALLMHAMRVNKGLESLWVAVSGSKEETEPGMNEVVSVLRHNKTLQSLINLRNTSLEVDVECRDQLLEALAENPTMEDFLMFGEEPSFSEQKNQIISDKMKYPCDEWIPALPRLPHDWMEGAKSYGFQITKGINTLWGLTRESLKSPEMSWLAPKLFIRKKT